MCPPVCCEWITLNTWTHFPVQLFLRLVNLIVNAMFGLDDEYQTYWPMDSLYDLREGVWIQKAVIKRFLYLQQRLQLSLNNIIDYTMSHFFEKYWQWSHNSYITSLMYFDLVAHSVTSERAAWKKPWHSTCVRKNHERMHVAIWLVIDQSAPQSRKQTRVPCCAHAGGAGCNDSLQELHVVHTLYIDKTVLNVYIMGV